MTEQVADHTQVWPRGAILFIGSGSLFSQVALRTVEAELNGPAERMPDLNALRFSRANGEIPPRRIRMVVADEANAKDLLSAVGAAAPFLPKCRLAIAFEETEAAAALFARENDRLFKARVSLLPMNTNITNWVRLLQLIDSGGHYVPPEVMHVRPGATVSLAVGADAAGAEADEGSERMDALTPREAEVLAMVASGSPNKTIATALSLSEHTVKLYMHRIIGKLGVRNRTEAAIWYHRNDNG